jgi:hypothetical protein
LGIVAAMFLAIMSMFYLQQLPGRGDLVRLENELLDEFGIYLSAAAPLRLEMVQPEAEGRRLGVEVTCTVRPDLRKQPSVVSHHLDRMAQFILEHKRWRGRIDLVRVNHTPPLKLSRTRRTPDRP